MIHFSVGCLFSFLHLGCVSARDAGLDNCGRMSGGCQDFVDCAKSMQGTVFLKAEASTRRHSNILHVYNMRKVNIQILLNYTSTSKWACWNYATAAVCTGKWKRERVKIALCHFVHNQKQGCNFHFGPLLTLLLGRSSSVDKNTRSPHRSAGSKRESRWPDHRPEPSPAGFNQTVWVERKEG